jgi:hypothetical protein
VAELQDPGGLRALLVDCIRRRWCWVMNESLKRCSVEIFYGFLNESKHEFNTTGSVWNWAGESMTYQVNCLSTVAFSLEAGRFHGIPWRTGYYRFSVASFDRSRNPIE